MRSPVSDWTRGTLILGLGLLCLTLASTCGGTRDGGGSPGDAIPSPKGFFTRNAGQIAHPEVLFYHNTGDMQVGFTEGGILMKIVEAPSWDPDAPPPEGESVEAPAPRMVKGAVVGVTFRGANPVLPEGVGRLPFPSHFLRGPDPERWRTDVPSFREVAYRNIYDGIDLVYRVGPEGLKYEFHCLPGSDPRRIELAYEGITGLEIDAAGDLLVRTSVGEVVDSAPIAFRPEAKGASRVAPRGGAPISAVRTAYVRRSETSIGFDVDGWDGETPLIIDPLIYSTYLGGKRTELIRSIVTDEDGFAYVTGWTISEDFPITKAAFQEEYTLSMEVFVVKIKQGGKGIFYATYFGGTDQDDAFTIRIDSNRDLYLTGMTKSTDFPVTDSSTHSGGPFDAFVVKLDNRAKKLLYGGYLGGSGDDKGYSLDIDDTGAAYVAGFTRSYDFPATVGAFDTTFHGGGIDGFAAKVDSNAGSLVYATYLGGRAPDYAWSIAVDSGGEAYVTGSSLSPDFPVTAGSFGPTYHGGQDAYVAKLNATGSALVYCGFLGGIGFDRSFTITVDGTGAAYSCGITRSLDFPVTVGAFDVTYAGGDDAFLAKINPAGSAIAYAGYLGGTGVDEVHAILINGAGEPVLTGFTASTDFPVTAGAFDVTHNGGEDAFLVRVDSDGSGIAESTYLGGSDRDRGQAVTEDFEGNLLVAGETRSTDFPVSEKAFDQDLNGVRDGFVTKFGP